MYFMQILACLHFCFFLVWKQIGTKTRCMKVLQTILLLNAPFMWDGTIAFLLVMGNLTQFDSYRKRYDTRQFGNSVKIQGAFDPLCCINNVTLSPVKPNWKTISIQYSSTNGFVQVEIEHRAMTWRKQNEFESIPCIPTLHGFFV